MISHILDYVEQIDMHLVRKSHLLALRHEEDVTALAHSIKENGLLQPILIRRTDDAFEIVAGHRRFEACKRLRWKKIPACITELSDKDAFEIALTENIQRKSLDPIEEAEAFQKYVKEYGWGGVSELARRIGKSQEFVSQRIILLSLPDDVKKRIITRQLNPSAARELLWLKDADGQSSIANIVVEKKIPTRTVRSLVKSLGIDLRDSSDINDSAACDPDYENYKRTKERSDPSTEVLDKTILALRVCMVKLDSILGGMEHEQQSYIREFILSQRRSIHTLVDDAVKVKLGLRQKPVAR